MPSSFQIFFFMFLLKDILTGDFVAYFFSYLVWVIAFGVGGCFLPVVEFWFYLVSIPIPFLFYLFCLLLVPLSM